MSLQTLSTALDKTNRKSLAQELDEFLSDGPRSTLDQSLGEALSLIDEHQQNDVEGMEPHYYRWLKAILENRRTNSLEGSYAVRELKKSPAHIRADLQTLKQYLAAAPLVEDFDDRIAALEKISREANDRFRAAESELPALRRKALEAETARSHLSQTKIALQKTIRENAWLVGNDE